MNNDVKMKEKFEIIFNIQGKSIPIYSLIPEQFNIKILYLDHIDITKNLIKITSNSKIKKMNLKYVNIKKEVELMFNFEKLKELFITHKDPDESRIQDICKLLKGNCCLQHLFIDCFSYQNLELFTILNQSKVKKLHINYEFTQGYIDPNMSYFLKDLNIHEMFNPNLQTLNTFIKNNKDLETLNLGYSSKSHDQIIDTLTELKHLTSLDFSKVLQFTTSKMVDFLKNNQTIKELNIGTWCLYLDQNDLSKVFSQNKTVQKLVMTSFIPEILTYQNGLIILHLECHLNIKDLEYLFQCVKKSKLKELKLLKYGSKSVKLYQSFISSNFEHLQSLSFCLREEEIKEFSMECLHYNTNLISLEIKSDKNGLNHRLFIEKFDYLNLRIKQLSLYNYTLKELYIKDTIQALKIDCIERFLERNQQLEKINQMKIMNLKSKDVNFQLI